MEDIMNEQERKLIYRPPTKTEKDLAWTTVIAGLAAASEVIRIAGATSIRVRGEFTKAGTLRVALLHHNQTDEITDPAPQTLAMVADTEGMIEFTGIIGESYAKITFTADADDSTVTAVWVHYTTTGSVEISAILEGDVEIGAVEIKDADADTRAKVAAAAAVSEAHNLLGTKDPTIGLAADAKVDTDAVGTLSSKLRGVVSHLATLEKAPLTDTEIRATALPVSGPVTDTELRATAVPVSGPLTDTEIRATALPVSGPLTDTELRAAVVLISGRSKEDTFTFARPDNVTVYAIGDVVGDAVADTDTTPLPGITVASAVGGSGYITSVELAINQTTALFRPQLHFFNVAAPTTALGGDNVAFARLFANEAEYIGSQILPSFYLSPGAGADMVSARLDDLRIPFKCAAADTDIYVLLETLDAWTPVALKTVRGVVKVEEV
jgi:hypothetical protein